MGRRRPQKKHQPLLIPQTRGSRPLAPHLRGLLLPRPRPGWGCPLPPRAGAPWTGPGGRSSRGCSDGTRSSWWKGEGGCWGPSPGGLQPTSHRVPPPTFGVCCWRAPGAPGPGSGQLPFGSEAAKGKGLLGGGQDGQTLLGPTQSCAGGWTGCFVDSSARRPGSPVSTPGLRLRGPPAHPDTAASPTAALGRASSARVFTPEPAPRLRLSSQQTSSAAGPPEAPTLHLCPQRPETLPHPLTPRGPLAPSPAPAWLSRPIGVCPCPRPALPPPLPGTIRFLPKPLHSAAPSTLGCPAPPVHQAETTTFSLNVAAAKL